MYSNYKMPLYNIIIVYFKLKRGKSLKTDSLKHGLLQKNCLNFILIDDETRFDPTDENLSSPIFSAIFLF